MSIYENITQEELLTKIDALNVQIEKNNKVFKTFIYYISNFDKDNIIKKLKVLLTKIKSNKNIEKSKYLTEIITILGQLKNNFLTLKQFYFYKLKRYDNYMDCVSEKIKLNNTMKVNFKELYNQNLLKEDIIPDFFCYDKSYVESCKKRMKEYTFVQFIKERISIDFDFESFYNKYTHEINVEWLNCFQKQTKNR